MNILKAKEITKNWAGKWFWSFGSPSSKGVGIFLSDNLNFRLDQFYYDSNGRILLVDIAIDVVKFRLLKCILTWNFVENGNLDRNNLSDNVGTFGKVEISKLKSDFHLTYRFLNPDKIDYTWQTAGIASRPNRFYVSKCLEKNIKTIEVINCPFSDHKLCTLTLQNLNQIKTFGQGYWKCNVSILGDATFVQDFNLLVHHLELFENKDLVWWENFKIQTKDLIRHSKI